MNQTATCPHCQQPMNVVDVGVRGMSAPQSDAAQGSFMFGMLGLAGIPLILFGIYVMVDAGSVGSGVPCVLMGGLLLPSLAGFAQATRLSQNLKWVCPSCGFNFDKV